MFKAPCILESCKWQHGRAIEHLEIIPARVEATGWLTSDLKAIYVHLQLQCLLELSMAIITMNMQKYQT